ncbi:hypothetical protein MMC08_006479 [Hypocenomyce scalaris]|nr:hypothetical protein [Hypocenomyce scalaris]
MDIRDAHGRRVPPTPPDRRLPRQHLLLRRFQPRYHLRRPHTPQHPHLDPPPHPRPPLPQPRERERERDESQSTPSSQARWGAEPALPLLMLESGADPNGGGFGRLASLTIAMKEQPVELIGAFVKRRVQLRGASWRVRFARAAWTW